SAVTKPSAYLENVYQDEQGKVNFFETSYTQNGRAVFGLEDLGDYADPRDLDTVDFMLILNRNENIIPAVARLTRTQAAAYFMLGETTGTSAGGKAEEGKFLRVPGTNPFFPLRQDQHGNRILELLDSHPDMEVYLMNTGRVGGKDEHEGSKKVKIPHSSAVVKGIAEGTISWAEDPDFGYEVAESVPGFDDEELLQPRRLYERQGRMDEYDAMVDRLKTERVEFLKRFEGLDEEIIKAVG
ncbi:MAG TPA: phosphoenolpyruvate carboxykinase (ATP), partial [Actinomycetota bacterium]